MTAQASHRSTSLAIIGSAGVPHRYGGFEAFVEHCGPQLLSHFSDVFVSCDRAMYDDKSPRYRGMARGFPFFRANGAQSILHDFAAFLWALPKARFILILGVSGGPWFPLMRLLAGLSGARIAVNIDGVEWQRGKHGRLRQKALRAFDWLAQACAHVVVYDNAALRPYLIRMAGRKAHLIAYSGDHAAPASPAPQRDGIHALTICRIEPENNIDLLIEGFLASRGDSYTVVGNWNASLYGREIRARYQQERRLLLLDPVYEPASILRLRSEATVYLHGHSVGGTNPSLVEMLFFDCRVLCYDVPYHRATAGATAEYFADRAALSSLLDTPRPAQQPRDSHRRSYSATEIARQYAAAVAARPTSAAL